MTRRRSVGSHSRTRTPLWGAHPRPVWPLPHWTVSELGRQVAISQIQCLCVPYASKLDQLPPLRGVLPIARAVACARRWGNHVRGSLMLSLPSLTRGNPYNHTRMSSISAQAVIQHPLDVLESLTVAIEGRALPPSFQGQAYLVVGLYGVLVNFSSLPLISRLTTFDRVSLCAIAGCANSCKDGRLFTRIASNGKLTPGQNRCFHPEPALISFRTYRRAPPHQWRYISQTSVTHDWRLGWLHPSGHHESVPDDVLAMLDSRYLLHRAASGARRRSWRHRGFSAHALPPTLLFWYRLPILYYHTQLKMFPSRMDGHLDASHRAAHSSRARPLSRPAPHLSNRACPRVDHLPSPVRIRGPIDNSVHSGPT